MVHLSCKADTCTNWILLVRKLKGELSDVSALFEEVFLGTSISNVLEVLEDDRDDILIPFNTLFGKGYIYFKHRQ